LLRLGLRRVSGRPGVLGKLAPEAHAGAGDKRRQLRLGYYG
jgi:hypothetical protein